jgi:hypothetical protein
MAQQTSIHFQPVKGGSEEHNKREKTLGYVHKELSKGNEYWESDNQERRLADLKALYKAKTGQTMQAKATPIREAVVVIDEKTTLNTLKSLSDALKQRWGIDVFQVAIHRDEGYLRGKNGKLNLHAHLVADWTNHETGRSLKLSRQDMAEMQTLCAEVLGMERGKSSDRKRLSAIQYKVEAQAKAAEELEQRNATLEASIARNEQRTGILPSIQAIWGGGEKSKAKVAIKAAEVAKVKAKREIARIKAETQREIKSTRETAERRAEAKIAEYDVIIKKTNRALEEIERHRSSIVQEGRAEAVKDVLAAAKLHFTDTKNENVTAEQIGKSWRTDWENAAKGKEELERVKAEHAKETQNLKSQMERMCTKEEAEEMRTKNASLRYERDTLQSELNNIKASIMYKKAIEWIENLITKAIEALHDHFGRGGYGRNGADFLRYSKSAINDVAQGVCAICDKHGWDITKQNEADRAGEELLRLAHNRYNDYGSLNSTRMNNDVYEITDSLCHQQQEILNQGRGLGR